MPFVYSSMVSGSGAGVDNTAPIPLPAINRYMRPLGNDMGQMATGINVRHSLPRRIEYLPLKPQYDMKFDRIGTYFGGLNSCIDDWYYRFGLYSSNDNYPATLLNDFGSLSVEASSPPSVGPIEITGLDVSLTGGTLYWIAVGVNQSAGNDTSAGRTPFLGILTGDYVNMHRKGMPNAAGNPGGLCFVEQVNSFAAVFPTSTSFTNCQGSSSLAIRPVVRRSA